MPIFICLTNMDLGLPGTRGRLQRIVESASFYIYGMTHVCVVCDLLQWQIHIKVVIASHGMTHEK